MSNEIRRSKVYTYFHGAGAVFQKFVLLVGVFMLLLSPVANSCAYKAYENKLERLDRAIEVASSDRSIRNKEYLTLYNDLRKEIGYSAKYSHVDIEKGDKLKKEKEELNKAYQKYLDACDKVDAAEEKYQSFRSGEPSNVWEGVLIAFGAIVVLYGLIWAIVKKYTFDKSEERAVDEVLAEKIEEAKQRALGKFNIVAEQVDKVEPVVLNGVADIKNNGNTTAHSYGFRQGVVKSFIFIGKVLAYAALLTLLVLLNSLLAIGMGIPFIIVLILDMGLLGYGGYRIYNKYEVDSYINPKVIDALENFDPMLISKLGTDDRIRVSVPAITVYMFGEDQLYMYYQYIDLVTEKIFCEGVHEYFYKDIVAVTSTQETKRIFKKEDFFSSKKIEYLRENVTIVSSGCTHEESYIVDMGNSLLDTAFIGMRNLIRQKKMEK